MSLKENQLKNIWAFFVYALLTGLCFRKSFQGTDTIKGVITALQVIIIEKYENIMRIIGYIFINCTAMAHNIYFGILVQYIIASSVVIDIAMPLLPVDMQNIYVLSCVKGALIILSFIYLYILKNDLVAFDKNLKIVCHRLKFKLVILCSLFITWSGFIVMLYLVLPDLIKNCHSLNSLLGNMLIAWTLMTILNFIRISTIISVFFDHTFLKLLKHAFLSFYYSLFVVFVKMLHILRPINFGSFKYLESILSIYNKPVGYIREMLKEIVDKNYWYAEVNMVVHNLTILDSIIDTDRYFEPSLTYYRIFAVPILINMFFIKDYWELDFVSRICLVMILYALVQMIFTCFYCFSMKDLFDIELKEIEKRCLIASGNAVSENFHENGSRSGKDKSDDDGNNTKVILGTGSIENESVDNENHTLQFNNFEKKGPKNVGFRSNLLENNIISNRDTINNDSMINNNDSMINNNTNHEHMVNDDNHMINNDPNHDHMVNDDHRNNHVINDDHHYNHMVLNDPNHDNPVNDDNHMVNDNLIIDNNEPINKMYNHMDHTDALVNNNKGTTIDKLVKDVSEYANPGNSDLLNPILGHTDPTTEKTTKKNFLNDEIQFSDPENIKSKKTHLSKIDEKLILPKKKATQKSDPRTNSSKNRDIFSDPEIFDFES